MIDIWKSIWVGTKRRYRQGASAAFAFVGILWTVTEMAGWISPVLKTFLEGHRTVYLAVAVIGSTITFLLRVFEPRRVVFCIPNLNTKVTLKFGDLFEEDADIVVAVTEHVDSQIGQRVAPNSVHGQLIQRWFTSEAAFRQAADTALVGKPFNLSNRSPGPNACYPLGTTVRVGTGERQAYLLVFAHSDPVTDKAFVDLSEAIAATRQLLLYVHSYSGGRPVALPLLGNGQSGLNLKPQHLLRLLVLLIVAVAREKGLPKDVRVCLHDDCFEELDLREVARDWRR